MNLIRERPGMVIVQSRGEMATHHGPEALLETTFLMTAETLNATIASGGGIRLILAGFDEERPRARRRRKRARRR